MPAYYNEFDPYAAQWLRNLIAAGHLPAGDVDERDIREVRADDLEGYEQCHFFAGIGGWAYAARLAGWADDRPVWTASCPCPPFSAAGKRQRCPECQSRLLVWCPRRTGFAICAACGHAWLADARHLWPEVWWLAAERRPERIFGEQVESVEGVDWLAGVRGSLEILGYAVGAPDLPAAGVGAPHIRQRLWWVADADGGQSRHRGLQPGEQHRFEPQDRGAGRLEHAPGDGRLERRAESGGRCAAGGCGPGGLGDSSCDDERESRTSQAGDEPQVEAGGSGLSGGAHLHMPGDLRLRVPGARGGRGALQRALSDTQPQPRADSGMPGARHGFWSAYDLIPCADGKARRVGPGIQPLAHGVSARVGKLRAAGNAIVAQEGAVFMRSYMEARLV